MYRTMSGCLGREHLWVDGNSGHNGIPKERLGPGRAVPLHHGVRVRGTCDRQQSARPANLRRVLVGLPLPQSVSIMLKASAARPLARLTSTYRVASLRSTCSRRSSFPAEGSTVRRERGAKSAWSLIALSVQGSCKGVKRALSTYLARSAAIATAAAPVSSYHDQSQHLPDVTHDDLPIVSQDVGQVAIGWSTREWSRLYVLFRIVVARFNAWTMGI